MTPTAEEALTKQDQVTFRNCLEEEIERLRRFIQQEINFQERNYMIGRNQVLADDIVDTAVLEALEKAPEKAELCPAKDWLYQKALQILNSKVAEIKKRESQEKPLNTDVPDRPDAGDSEDLGDEAKDFWVLDEDLKIVDLIAALNDTGRTPAEKLSEKELQEFFLTNLEKLPALERESFLLNALEGQDTKLIATAQERSVPEVEKDIKTAREKILKQFEAEKLF